MNLTSELREFLQDRWIIVIEPAVNYKQSIRQFLTNLKIKNFRIVSNTAEAQRDMLTKKVAFFICEWRLPEKNGLEFCRWLRSQDEHRNTPFMLISTENLRKDVILASEVGINRYLLKPFSYEDFYAQLQWTLQTAANPDPVFLVLDEADQCLREGDSSNARRLFEKALSLKPDSAKAHCGMARLLLAKDMIDRALQHLQLAISANTDYLDAYRIILSVHEKKGSLHGMIQAASILHSMSPDNPKYPLIVAKAYMDLDNFDASEKHYKIAVRLSPTLADGYRGLGNVYLHQKQFEKAQKNFEKALDLGIGDVSTLNGLGLALVRQGMVDEGIRRYELALKIDAEDARVLFNLGLASEISGKMERARHCYTRALLSQPNFDKAKRGITRIESGNPISFEERNELLTKKAG